ncbi:hypothetical protein ACFQ5D_02020 [Paenibacillus farraposensis]|uniref:Uncharacterized protein n=1 Tax=Paenibacillus farraposensis TaxID=2807095 RepID=A0ABW4D908_9BACL
MDNEQEKRHPKTFEPLSFEWHVRDECHNHRGFRAILFAGYAIYPSDFRSSSYTWLWFCRLSGHLAADRIIGGLVTHMSVEMLIGFPPVALALLAGFSAATGPAFADMGYDIATAVKIFD